MPQTKSTLFEEACIEIRKRDLVTKAKYKLIGKGRDKAVTLKGAYANIAAKHLYYEAKSKTRVFSWQQVTDACILADIFVTDVVSKQL